MNHLAHACCNRKVLAGLALVALGLFVFSPALALAALPILLLALCPLSFLTVAVLVGLGKLRGRHAPLAGALPQEPRRLLHGATTREEALRRLTMQLQEIEAERMAIRRHLQELKQARPMPSPSRQEQA